MFKFLKPFKIITTLDFAGNNDEDNIAELEDQVIEICKHFSIAYSKRKIKMIDTHQTALRKVCDNLVAFRPVVKKIEIVWYCIISSDKWNDFLIGVNDYIEEKGYGEFTVYE